MYLHSFTLKGLVRDEFNLISELKLRLVIIYLRLYNMINIITEIFMFATVPSLLVPSFSELPSLRFPNFLYFPPFLHPVLRLAGI